MRATTRKGTRKIDSANALAAFRRFSLPNHVTVRPGRCGLGLLLAFAGCLTARAQIDPARRELIQAGYNQPIEGSAPLAAYVFYFLNKPDYLQNTNLTLRLAVAPVYLDSELGIARALGTKTDVGIGLAGGGFADSYYAFKDGYYDRSSSFVGNGGEVSGSIYHRFNPEQRIPLYAVLRGAVHYTAFEADQDTASNFLLPDNQFFIRVRTGLRWGGREPVMLPNAAMEVSVWYEGSFRTQPGRYGIDRSLELNPDSHRFWLRGLLAYTLPELRHNFEVTVTAGTGVNLDRLSAYRLGGNLPLGAEFPLSLPGYFFQELSARSFVLMGGAYSIPLDKQQQWRVSALATTACVDYIPGLAQPGHWNSGVGAGLVYRSPTDSWQIAVGYGYGIDAIRNGQRGAQSVSILLQFDLDRTRRRLFDPSEEIPQSRGLQEIFRGIFN